MKAEADAVKGILNSLVSNWEHKPRFAMRSTTHGGTFTLSVHPVGENARIFKWVDEGTEGGYIISPRKPGGWIVYNDPYTPRTQRGSLTSRASSYGNTIVMRKSVTHPGIEARLFSQKIVNKRRLAFYSRIRAALRRSAL